MRRSVKKTLLRCAAAITFAVCILAAGSVFAHHSFSVEFDRNKPVTLKATITKMEWVNPHAWLFVDVKGPDGKVVNWAVEFGGANSLYRRGWRNEDLPAGAAVVITGHRARNGKPIAAAQDVQLANGKTLFAGSSGTGAPGDPGER
jgi:Family of unknown function (DUF6152)